ncbi:MAG TPA: hypothetical protein P5120_13065 [Spirochaetota bacterium]|nr:hypothetical protein [Spirochaetota bacterium]
MPENNSSLIPFLSSRDELSGKSSVSAINNAIDNFRHNSPAVPVEKLYTAYRSLKEIIDSMGPDFVSLAGHFNDIFLRILEERGESGSGIYRTVLRDSSEFRFLSGMFIKESVPEPETGSETAAEIPEPDEPPARVTLKGVLADKKISLTYYSEDQWSELVEEHFNDIADEQELVKTSGTVLNRIIRRGDSSDYHILIIVSCIFGKFKGFKKLEISSKEYAMKLVNMVSDKSEAWNRLHVDYLDIIKK